MKHTLNAAAKLSGRAKSTISKAIKDGRLSAGKNDKGGFEIDGAELSRVFPFPAEDQSSVPQPNTKNEHENSVLEVELKAERQMRERLESEIDDLRVQRDKWQLQAERLLLEKPVTPVPEPVAIKPTNQNTPPEAEKKSRGVLARLFGG